MAPVVLTAVGDFISRVGFPIFVAVFLLYRLQSMHDEHIRTIRAMTSAIDTLDKCIIDRFRDLADVLCAAKNVDPNALPKRNRNRRS